MREDPLPADSGPHGLTEDAAAHVWFTGMSLVRSQTALGAFYRRLAVRVGQPKAITATARKLAILAYRTLNGTLVYRDPGAHTYNAHGSCADFANAPTRRALRSSTGRPGRYWGQQFLRSARDGCRRVWISLGATRTG